MRKLITIAALGALAIAMVALASCSTGAVRPGYRYVHESAADVDIDTGAHVHDVWVPTDVAVDAR